MCTTMQHCCRCCPARTLIGSQMLVDRTSLCLILVIEHVLSWQGKLSAFVLMHMIRAAGNQLCVMGHFAEQQCISCSWISVPERRTAASCRRHMLELSRLLAKLFQTWVNYTYRICSYVFEIARHTSTSSPRDVQQHSQADIVSQCHWS